MEILRSYIRQAYLWIKHLMVGDRRGKFTAIAGACTGALSSGISAYDALRTAGPEKLQLIMISFVTGISAVAIISGYLFIKRYLAKISEKFLNITALMLQKKFNDVALSAIIYFAIGWVAYSNERLDILYVILVIALLQFATFILTFYRVVSGRFGYNSLEMKEIVHFIKGVDRGVLPPRIGGLRPGPLEVTHSPAGAAPFGASGVSS